MPKKTKKGGGGKGGGKTEEDRLLYLQQRAQAEDEMAKKKEELLTQFLKDKLQKEERNTAVNLLKLNEGWRTILRRTRAAELRQDLTVLSQTFERHLDGLDSVIKNLDRDLQEAERQSAQVWRVHLQHLERLWAQQDKRLRFLQQQWENGLQHLSSTFSSERKQMLENTQHQRADLDDVMFTVRQQHKTVMEELCKVREGSTTSEENYDKVDLDVHDKEQAVEKARQECSNETRKLDALLSRNQESIKMIGTSMKNVKMLQDVIMRLRKNLNSSKTENQSVERDLTAARDQAKRRTLELRNQLIQAQTVARKQLTDLTVQSDAAAKKLQAVITKGEGVLRVAEMCHKLESEQKKISSSLFTKDEQRRETTGAETEERAEEVRVFPELQQVTQRINAAVLQREALKRHKDDLSRENQQLRLLLRQHLDAMTVSDGAFDGCNALLAAYQAPTTAVPVDTNRHHTVIEAAHAVKHSL